MEKKKNCTLGNTDNWSKENRQMFLSWNLELERRRLLTDVVVFMTWTELKAQRERCEQLKLLWELEGPIWTYWAVAFPAFKAFHVVVAGGIAIIIDHEKDVAFHALLRKMFLVVRTVDIQVVIDGHLHSVFTMQESKGINKLKAYKTAKVIKKPE